MNILLIYPKYPDTFWSYKHVLKFISKKAAFPPLGLLTVASMLPKEWDKKLVDVNVEPLTDEHIEWADMVFISAMIIQEQSTLDIINRCNGKIIVAGGPAFNVDHEKFKNVNHFILDEAEITLPLFLDDLSNGKAKHVYTSNIRPDITKTPLPSWSLINMKNYATMSIQYSRGCPYNCEFCDIIVLNGRVPRTKTPEQLINEFQSLYDAGWRGSIFIVDDNFIGNKLNVKKMLPYVIDWQKKHSYPFRLTTEASANLANDNELMQMMSDANFVKVFLGIETPSVDGLNECGKFQNVGTDLSEAVKTIQKNGMQVLGGFIVGFDTDTESIFETQMKFIQKIGVVVAMVGMLNAIPKTRLWYRLKSEGRLLGDPSGENTDATINFIPKMGKEKLVDGYKRLISNLYSHKHYYRRINTFIKDYKPTVKSRISFRDCKAFIKSVWKIGILSRARFRYWKLIIKTGLTKKKAFPVAVELAILGMHFEKVANAIVRVV